MKVLKQKKCKACGDDFPPFSTMSKVCSPLCAQKYVHDENEKKAKRRIRLKKELLKTRSDCIKEAQIVFNRYIRLRDIHCVCISCQKPPKKKNAGHYRSTGACPELRFCELNVHLQCEYCNTHLSSNAIEYRINLVKKIGVDKVEWLEGKHDPLKLTIDEIKELKKKYASLCKQMEKDYIDNEG